MRLIKKLIWILFLLFMCLSCIAVGYYFAVTKEVSLHHEKLQLSEHNVTLYDCYGEMILNVGALSNKQSVPIDEIPKHTQLAFVSTEDKRFYTHSGFDVKRIVRAAYNNLKARTFKEGASTISQQLIKNTHLSQEKTVKRKLREWKLTRTLERKYTKDEILEKYLNTIYFGHSCFGIRAASEFYFGKLPCDLTMGESAILAGLVKSPNNYSPFKNPTRCLERKKTVLSLMRQQGCLSLEEEISALNEELPSQPENCKEAHGYFNHVFDELTEIAAAHGLRLGGKVEIYTGFDPKLQKELNQAVADITCDKTAYVLNGNSGLFRACVSTIGNLKRLPGSLIKPLLVYAPALEENVLSPATPILDEKVNYSGYSPENYDKTYHGYVSTRTAVANSLNIPAVKTLQSLGIEKASAYMKKMQLPIDNTDKSLALALGGMREGFRLRDLTTAYTALQNGGKMTNSAFIQALSINQVPVYRFKRNEHEVFSKETAYLMTDMLKTAVEKGTAKKLRNLPFEIAAKTGTVGTDKGNTDAYALSYTTQDVVSIWLGNADNRIIQETGGGMPCHVLQHINDYLYKQYGKIPSFERPQNVVEISLDKISYYDTHTMLLSDENSPMEYRMNELFNKRFIPLKKSDFFSNPSILSPTVKMLANKVVITLHKHSSTLYQYHIDRYDYVRHTTVYEGPYLENFYDNSIEYNKQYVYTVTPIYNGKRGVPITLPTISTNTQFLDNQIKEKEWWQY